MGRSALHDIKVKDITGSESDISNLRSEKSLHNGLSKHLVYELDIDLNRESIGQHGFVFGGTRVFPIFEKLKEFLQSACAADQPRHHLRFVMGSNHYVTDVVEVFLSSLNDHVPDYAKFYPYHPDKHFLQIGDYPKPENRPLVSVPASVILETWSKYTTAYGYGAIYEHEIAVNARTRLRQMVFRLRVMDVPNSGGNFYIGFIEKRDENDVRINVGDVLKVNFDTQARVETESWTAVVIKPLPFASWSEICIALFRRYDRDANAYDERDLNLLPVDIKGWAAAKSRIYEHPAH